MQSGWLLRGGHVLAAAELAESFADRTRGLLGHRQYDGAMLLPRTRAVHTFGMHFPIDVAFMTADLEVVSTTRMAEHRLCRPRRRCRWVLEASAGSFDRWRLQVGDRLEFRETA